MEKVLVIGATSAIAEATARLFAEKGASLYLLARNESRLADLASDLKIRGAVEVGYAAFDACDFASHAPLVERAVESMGGCDVALIAHGTLSDQQACEQSFEVTQQELNINALSFISLLTHLANRFEAEKRGTIAVISSVAGDRGRQSNYVYGTAKAAVSTFCQGLRNRLHKSGVHVLTIKPGFVDTPMTAAFKKGPLWASPEKVAAGIHRAIQKKRDIVYLPGKWRLIMLVIKMIPERVFKGLKL